MVLKGARDASWLECAVFVVGYDDILGNDLFDRFIATIPHRDLRASDKAMHIQHRGADLDKIPSGFDHRIKSCVYDGYAVWFIGMKIRQRVTAIACLI